MALEPPKPFEEDHKERDFEDVEEEEIASDLTFEEICPIWSDRIRNWDQLTI